MDEGAGRVHVVQVAPVVREVNCNASNILVRRRFWFSRSMTQVAESGVVGECGPCQYKKGTKKSLGRPRQKAMDAMISRWCV